MLSTTQQQKRNSVLRGNKKWNDESDRKVFSLKIREKNRCCAAIKKWTGESERRTFLLKIREKYSALRGNKKWDGKSERETSLSKICEKNSTLGGNKKQNSKSERKTRSFRKLSKSVPLFLAAQRRIFFANFCEKGFPVALQFHCSCHAAPNFCSRIFGKKGVFIHFCRSN